MNKLIILFKLEQEIEQAKNRDNLALALQKYNEVIRIKHSISNKLGLAKSYVEKGYLHKLTGDKTRALDCYTIAANIAQKSKNPQFLEIVNNQINSLKYE